MKLFIMFSLVLALTGCSVNASKLDDGKVESFASKVRCKTGFKGGCWCFVASRQTGNADSTGIGMTLAPNAYCEGK